MLHRAVRDMTNKYKKMSQGGLAINAVAYK